MTYAPEWIYYQSNFAQPCVADMPPERASIHATEYVRTELVPAMLAAERAAGKAEGYRRGLEAAAGAATRILFKPEWATDTTGIAAEVRAAIYALIGGDDA